MAESPSNDNEIEEAIEELEVPLTKNSKNNHHDDKNNIQSQQQTNLTQMNNNNNNINSEKEELTLEINGPNTQIAIDSDSDEEDAEEDLEEEVNIFNAWRRLFRLPLPPSGRRSSTSSAVFFAEIWKKLAKFFFFFFFIPTLALLVALITDWPNTEKCSSVTLHYWSISQLMIQSSILGLNALVISKLHPRSFPREIREVMVRSMTKYYVFSRFLTLSWAINSIIGMVFTFSATQCVKQQTPFLFSWNFLFTIAQIVLFGLMIFFCGCFYSVMIRVLRLQNSSLLHHLRSKGATDEMLDQLKQRKFKPQLLKEDDTTCGICLEDYVKKELVTFLPCSHVFHSTCIEQWLIQNKSCPYCKQEIDQHLESAQTVPLWKQILGYL